MDKWTKGISSEIVQLYKDISELTKPKCAACPQPYGCCAPVWCELTENFGKYVGVELVGAEDPVSTSDGKVMKFLSKTGCVVPPYLRPLCAVHLCEGHLIGTCQDKCGEEFSEKYWELREEVNELDIDRLLGFSGMPYQVKISGYVENGVAVPIEGYITSQNMQELREKEAR